MNLVRLRAFHAVARDGSVTRAAARLNVSQPTVTVHVRALEATYGVALFSRSGYGVALTPFGRDLHDRTRRIFAELEDVEAFLEEAGRLDRGAITVGADGPFAAMDLLASYRTAYPGVRAAVRIGNTSEVVEDLRSERTDVAVVTAVEPTPEFVCLRLRRDRLVALVPAGHALGRRRRLQLRDLDGADMVVREAGSATRALLEDVCAQHDVRPRPVIELGSREAIREAVAAGLGISAIFESEAGRDERLRTVPIAAEGLEVTHEVACLPHRRTLRVVDAFFRVAQRHS